MMLRNAQLVEPSARGARYGGRSVSYSAETVTPEIAITSSAVISIITIMAQDTASLPLILYGRNGRNKFRAFDNPYYKLMHDQPNPETTSMVFRELIMSHILAWGNFFAQLIIDNRGTVVELWALRPDRMSVERVNGQKIYKYQSEKGQRVFFPDEILHIPGFGFDGLVGYSRIALARNAIGLAISTEKYGGSFFSNGANFDIIIKHPSALGEAAYKTLSESFNAKHAGGENSHRPLIIEENMSVEKIGIPPNDAQFLETRKFQLSEINRIIGPVPPHMIGDISNSTSWGSGIDSQEQGYVNHTLRPYAVRIEQALNTQLMLEADRAGGYFYEHLFDAFLRGDIATRFSAYTQAINNGIMNPNEVRAKENMNPYSGGDAYLRSTNTVSADGTASSNAAPVASANPLETLWRDAIARVMKREQNDVTGAARRYAKKNDAAGGAEWLNNFYGKEHPAFIAKQFSPIVEAHKRLTGADISDGVRALISKFTTERKSFVEQMTADELEAAFENYDAQAESFYEFFVGAMENGDE